MKESNNEENLHKLKSVLVPEPQVPFLFKSNKSLKGCGFELRSHSFSLQVWLEYLISNETDMKIRFTLHGGHSKTTQISNKQQESDCVYWPGDSLISIPLNVSEGARPKGWPSGAGPRWPQIVVCKGLQHPSSLSNLFPAPWPPHWTKQNTLTGLVKARAGSVCIYCVSGHVCSWVNRVLGVHSV